MWAWFEAPSLLKGVEMSTPRNIKCGCTDPECEYEAGFGYWHEALDRSSLATNFFAENVQEHPAVEHTKELREAAENVTGALYEFYCLVEDHYSKYEDKNELASDRKGK